MTAPRIVPDAFGWFLILNAAGETLQAFRTESECRAWLADTVAIRAALPHVTHGTLKDGEQ